MKNNIFVIALLLTSTFVWAGNVTVGVSGTAKDGSKVGGTGVGSSPAKALTDANKNMRRDAANNGGVKSVKPEKTKIITDTRKRGN